jgi:hypothetical protein
VIKIHRQLQSLLLLKLKLSLIQFMDLLGHQLYHFQISTQKLNSKNNKEEKYQEYTLLKLKLFLILNNLLEQQNKLLELNFLVPMTQKKLEDKKLKRIMAHFIIMLKKMKKTKIQLKQENQSNKRKNN